MKKATVSPSIVAVQYVWETELGRRELTGAGVIISAEGSVVMSIGVADPRIPDDQMKDFKIIVPQEDADPLEVDAIALSSCADDEITGRASLLVGGDGRVKHVTLENGATFYADAYNSILIACNAGAQ